MIEGFLDTTLTLFSNRDVPLPIKRIIPTVTLLFRSQRRFIRGKRALCSKFFEELFKWNVIR